MMTDAFESPNEAETEWRSAEEIGEAIGHPLDQIVGEVIGREYNAYFYERLHEAMDNATAEVVDKLPANGLGVLGMATPILFSKVAREDLACATATSKILKTRCNGCATGRASDAEQRARAMEHGVPGVQARHRHRGCDVVFRWQGNDVRIHFTIEPSGLED
jgi:hypothetical protein